MPRTVETATHLSIQTQVATNKLRTPLDRWPTRIGGRIAWESLELASGQMALCLAAPEGEEPILLDNLIEEYQAESGTNWFQLDQILPSEALRFLPASQRIVSMTFAAAGLEAHPLR